MVVVVAVVDVGFVVVVVVVAAATVVVTPVITVTIDVLVVLVIATIIIIIVAVIPIVISIDTNFLVITVPIIVVTAEGPRGLLRWPLVFIRWGIKKRNRPATLIDITIIINRNINRACTKDRVRRPVLALVSARALNTRMVVEWVNLHFHLMLFLLFFYNYFSIFHSCLYVLYKYSFLYFKHIYIEF